MPTGYQIYRQDGLYYLTFQIIDWVDIFTRQLYRDIVIESFRYCRNNKGMRLWAYVIMSNHVHVIMSAESGNLSDLIRDFKRHTASHILRSIDRKTESRRDWMLKRFEFAAMRHKRNSQYQFWTQENHAIELESHNFTMQKLAYIHENPVRAGLVDHADDWLYSSQRNYVDKGGLLEIDLLDLF